MGRTLQPEDRISHYRVVAPLGAGGMGEVYVAQDESLERSVALKTLPPHLVRNEERVRRFITEAKSASSLNHPNIVTIYEIGRDEVKSGASGDRQGDGAAPEAASAPIHFIAMELVAGETLTQKIHHEKTELRSLLGHIAQAAEGVAKAHAAGIVHRDLKPGNIMVSRDGYAKVLDFGLAKLTEKQASGGSQATNAPTEAAATGEGALMGTVGYMSPEQVQGKPADHRSDIFSMGCVLYEAATRRRPFIADTDVEIMHKILRERPTPVEELSPEVPAEVRRLVRRCLAKSPDERLQSMRDLAIELREIVDEYDTLSASTTSGSTMASRALGASQARSKRTGFNALIASVVLLGLAGLGFGIYSLMGRGGSGGAGDSGLGQMTITSIMSRNDLNEAVLSRDGRYLAYVIFANDKFSLNVRQVRTGSDVTIMPPQEFPIRGITFSPDSDYLYFLNRDQQLPNYSALYRVASLGGPQRKMLYDIDSAVSFAPDGARVSFRRGFPQVQADVLVVANLTTGEEKELIRVKYPESFYFAPTGTQTAQAWSPDGEHVVAAIFDATGGARTRVFDIDARTGARREVGSHPWLFVDSVGWLPDSRAFVSSGFVVGTFGFQIYRVSFPDGAVRKLTNDLEGYQGLSISGDGQSLAAIRRTEVYNLWAGAPDGSAEPQALSSATTSIAAMQNFEPLPDGGIAITAPQGNNVFLWRIESDGGGRRQLNTQGVYVISSDAAGGDSILFTQVDEDASTHIWRVDADGSGPRQITMGQSMQVQDVSPDGKWAIINKFSDRSTLWLLNLAGGEPTQLVAGTTGELAEFSPDGRSVLYTVYEQDQDRMYPGRRVAAVPDGRVLHSFRLPPGAFDLAWAPDGQAVTYIDRGTGMNVMRQAITGGEPTSLTRFTEGSVVNHEWSPDGKSIALHRRVGGHQGLWTMHPGDAALRRVAEFRTGNIANTAWSTDSKRLLFLYGNSSQDVVLITDFK